jgi:hypothetical protein
VSARLLATLLAALVTVTTAISSAQVSVQTQASGQKLEVGQTFQLEVQAMGNGQDTPSDPKLPVPAGFEVRGPSIGSQTQVSMVNGRVTQRTGISATWLLTPTRPGTFKIGPPSVQSGGTRHVGKVVTVEVVAQGSLPRARPGSPGFDPFSWLDPFGGASPFPPGFFGPSANDEQEQLPQVPEDLQVDQAPDPTAFLRAVVSPKRPVVGEQITLKIYAYGSRGTFREAHTTEPSRADFLAYSVVEGAHGEDWVRVPIGDTMFYAVKIRELALFPLHSGKVVIGPMTMTFDGGRYRSRAGVVRSTPKLEIEVEEPPLAGRPAGYKLGDVGELTLEARVDPQRVTAGDAVSVIAKLEGTGNIPISLNVPQRRGVEWLDPTLTEKVGPEGSVVRGYRTFNYVVKLLEPGVVDLGELTLPYFDPKKRAYATLQAKLGTVTVSPNPHRAQAKLPSDDPRDKALDLRPRKTLAAFARETSPFTDDARIFWFLFGAPALVAMAGVGLSFATTLRKRLADAKAGAPRLSLEALRAADEAAVRDEVATTASAVERALFLGIEASTGLRARAFLREDLARALTDAGLAEDLRRRTLALLDACEAARFTGKAGDLPPPRLAKDARECVTDLLRSRRGKRKLAA